MLIKACLLIIEDCQNFLNRINSITAKFLKKKIILPLRIRHRGGSIDDLNFTMSASCNSACYMLKDTRITVHLLFSLCSRKELSSCHSCYTLISLLLLLTHQLIYLG